MKDRDEVRILVVNGNTSEEVTRIVEAAARSAALSSTRIDAVTATSGPAVVQSAADHGEAERACMALAARHSDACDAIVIAVSLDTAVEDIAAALSMPVVGMTQAALDAAAATGRRIGVLTMGEAMKDMFLARFALPADAIVASIQMAPHDALLSRQTGDELMARLSEGVARLAREGAGIAVPIGATVAGLAGALQVDSSIPVLECMACAVREAERQVAERSRRSR